MPLENIEILQNINNYKNNLLNLSLENLFEEYQNKNLALIFIDDSKLNKEKNLYQDDNTRKKYITEVKFKKENLSTVKFNEKIIIETKKKLINLVKSKNLIDIRVPSFLNVKLDLSKKNNLVELNSRINKIDTIEKIYVQELNKDYVSLRIKYLGKLDKMINLLKIENIDLILVNDQWIIKTL